MVMFPFAVPIPICSPAIETVSLEGVVEAVLVSKCSAVCKWNTTQPICISGLEDE